MEMALAMRATENSRAAVFGGGGIMERWGTGLLVVCGLALAACGGKAEVGEADAPSGTVDARELMGADGDTKTGDAIGFDACEPYCGEEGEAECGDDGCGGSCGECEPGAVCGEADYEAIGICFNEAEQCPVICAGHECGDVWTGLMEPDSCDCGTCEGGFECVEDEEGNYCVDPDCTGEGCPPDKCWKGLEGEHGLGAPCSEDSDCDTGFCVSLEDEGPFCTYFCQDCCPTGHSCAQLPVDSPDIFFACLPDCQPDCEGKECGDDGCGGECPDLCNHECPGPIETCAPQGLCEALCVPACAGKMCGDDGCGCDCGECQATQEQCIGGQCVCQPDCAGQSCGDDGCGGSCGACNVDAWCSKDGQCELATCSIITDCLDDCPESDYACQDGCVAGAPAGIQEAFQALLDCMVIPPDCWCDGLDPESPEAEECWDACMDYCDSQYLACWPPGDGTCSDLYVCLVSCPDGDAGQSCADDCFGDASLDAQDLWDAFIDCLDDSGYFGCEEADLKCYDNAWGQCLAALNGCLCDPECPEVLCEFESCDGLDNDCDGDSDEDFLKDCNEDEDDLAACVDDDDDNDGLQDDKDNCPCDYNPDQKDHDCDGHGDPCDDDDDGDGVADKDDCAPLDYFVHPGHVEACDGVDNDCDGKVDENCQCVPDCTGKECGDDGCGGSCGQCSTECPPLLTCNEWGKCE